MAVAAPELSESSIGSKVLSSEDPASLFNACRYAAFLAENDIGAWGNSNWAVSRKARRETFLLMRSLKGDSPAFERLLAEIKPNVLLIGAMSVCLPGAIACAQKAKELFGQEICIVLGGRHASETIYQEQDGRVVNHPGSPLRLMAEGHIPEVFDLVVSGEGEHIIAWIGEKVSDFELQKIQPAMISSHLQGLFQVPGRWIAGWASEGEVHAIKGKSGNFDRNLLASPVGMFGVNSAFGVFGGRLTAHVFSDTGNGCAYDCEFCSERRSATGPLVQIETSGDRLFRQMSDTVCVVREDSPAFGASAFIEDSTILGGSNLALNRLVELLSKKRLDIKFGGQFTIDQLSSKIELLQRLKEVGLDYLFIGMETLDPGAVGGISKDIGHNKDTWLKRTERAIESLRSLKIQCGISLLFGLGESHDSRIRLLHQVDHWRKTYGSPNPVAFNWAVQHPLRGNDGKTGYRYVEWGLPTSSWLEAFRDFGEASVPYPIAGQKSPVLEEVQEVADFCRELLGTNKSATINP
ncbi:B12-binding domain/radical SAM domain-containing protein [Patescibacteria group bacterium]|nr:B12-binding domain/radical SAM domain-containing protein [Patescibacteria group bacterium]